MSELVKGLLAFCGGSLFGIVGVSLYIWYRIAKDWGEHY